jgi:hypothetical protein
MSVSPVEQAAPNWGRNRECLGSDHGVVPAAWNNRSSALPCRQMASRIHWQKLPAAGGRKIFRAVMSQQKAQSVPLGRGDDDPDQAQLWCNLIYTKLKLGRLFKSLFTGLRFWVETTNRARVAGISFAFLGSHCDQKSWVRISVRRRQISSP